MIIRVDRAFRPDIAAQDFDRAIGDDFIGVHIGAGAGAGLENVHREMSIVTTGRHRIACLDDGISLGLVQHAEVCIGTGRRCLDHAERMDEARGHRHAAKPKVVYGALRLRPVQCRRWHRHLSHAVVFNARFSTHHYPPRSRRRSELAGVPLHIKHPGVASNPRQ